MFFIGFGFFFIAYLVGTFLLFAPLAFVSVIVFIAGPFWYRRHICKKYMRRHPEDLEFKAEWEAQTRTGLLHTVRY